MCICCTEDFLDKLISPDDLIEGSKISPGPVLVDMMVSPDYKVFTF